jgi:hypothetical protein
MLGSLHKSDKVLVERVRADDDGNFWEAFLGEMMLGGRLFDDDEPGDVKLDTRMLVEAVFGDQGLDDQALAADSELNPHNAS